MNVPERLISALDSDDPLIVSAAIVALQEMGNPAVIDNIKALLSHTSSDVRVRALRYLVIHAEKTPLPLNVLTTCFALEAPFGDEAFYHADCAMLIANQGNNGIEYLVQQIDNTQLASFKRRAALDGLGSMLIAAPENYQHRLDWLQQLLHDADHYIIGDVLWLLGKLKIPLENGLVTRFQHHSFPFIRGRYLDYLSLVDNNNAFPQLLRGLSDDSDLVKAFAVDAIDDYCDLTPAQKVAFVQVLRELFPSKSNDLNQAITTALAHL